MYFSLIDWRERIERSKQIFRWVLLQALTTNIVTLLIALFLAHPDILSWVSNVRNASVVAEAGGKRTFVRLLPNAIVGE